MATLVNFVAPTVQPFTFQAMLDGITYTIVVNWNLGGARYYVNIYTIAGVRVLTIPMIGSPPGFNISLTAGYFVTQLIWRVQNNQFEII